MVEQSTIIALVVFAILVALAILTNGIKIIRPYEQGIYMRLGGTSGS